MATRPDIQDIPIEVVPTGSDASDTDVFLNGLWKQNPVFVQVLGMCPVLAVTNTAINSLAMGLATLFVLTMSNLLVASLRRVIPQQVRIATYIMIIATFVTAVDYIIQAIDLELHKALGAFVSLIVVNCLILGRAEAFASRNTVRKSVMDGLGMGIGFTFSLLCLGIVRELLGNGSVFNLPLLPESYQEWIVMILPSGGFFTLGILLLIFNWFKRKQEQQEQKAGATS